MSERYSFFSGVNPELILFYLIPVQRVCHVRRGGVHRGQPCSGLEQHRSCVDPALGKFKSSQLALDSHYRETKKDDK